MEEYIIYHSGEVFEVVSAGNALEAFEKVRPLLAAGQEVEKTQQDETPDRFLWVEFLLLPGREQVYIINKRFEKISDRIGTILDEVDAYLSTHPEDIDWDRVLRVSTSADPWEDPLGMQIWAEVAPPEEPLREGERLWSEISPQQPVDLDQMGQELVNEVLTLAYPPKEYYGDEY